jgi:hypothetical protein
MERMTNERPRLRDLWSRLIAGDGGRKSRFHTMGGARVDAAALPYLPRTLWTTFLLKVFGYRVQEPWLGYRAVARLEQVLSPDSRVLEFGSGMSTLWFARRCATVVSVESDPGWYDEMQRRFGELGVTNVDYRLREPAMYTDHPDLARASFDLALVDGIARDEEALAAVALVKPGGFILFDNSDVPYGPWLAARATLLAAAEPGSVTIYNDLYPTQLSVMESLLIKTRQRYVAGAPQT